jgi:elongation factor P
MAYLASNALREGSLFVYDGQKYLVLKYQHIKKGRGQAVIRVKVKNIITRSNTELTFSNEEKLEEFDAEKRSAQYLYKDGSQYFFMDNENFNQYELEEDTLDGKSEYLIDGMKVVVLFVDGVPLSIDLPKSVVLEVKDTEPAVAGNTATGASKVAILETGLSLLVPLFIKIGDKIKINTETGKYTARE